MLFVNGKRVVHRELRTHQIEAVVQASALLATHARTNVVMACGSGKTLVGLRIAKTANRVLMLEPSLSLIRQALEEARMDGLLEHRTVICVCSDKTLASDDQWKVTDEELGLPVTTDSPVLRDLLQRSSEKCVVFCTYQSQPLLRDSLPAGFRFDFGYFDEAHRTAGIRERTFSLALSDEYIPIGRRLFLTATPRLFAEQEDDQELRAYSMDDEATYGPRAYELTLAQAIERNIVCDYQVLTACVSGSEVQEAIKRASDLFLPQSKLPVELVAGQIAVVRAIQSTGVKRVVTFHATIEEAAAFTRDRLKIYKQAGITPFHINGNMPGRQRQAVIKAFLAVDGPALMTNCHCLTEGVDVPEIDMVGIMCRKESVQELVQAVGRALRNRPGKERGYVMLPLYVSEHEPLEAALERSDMGITWEILHSVLEADGAISNKLVQPRAESDQDAGITRQSRGHLRIVAPEALFEGLQQAISVRHIHRLGARWDVMIAAAARYVSREGQLDVPVDHLEDSLPLGRWIEKQRLLRKRRRLSAQRVDQLTGLGILWDTQDAKWTVGFELAKKFRDSHGHLNVPASETVIRSWLRTARRRARKGMLPLRQLQLLTESGLDLQVQNGVEEKLKALEHWRLANPQGLPGIRGPQSELGIFLKSAAARWRQGKLGPAIVERLSQIGIDIRLPGRAAVIENKLKALEEWRFAHPEQNRPARTGEYRELGFFVSNCVARYRLGKLEQTTIDRLMNIGIDIRKAPTKRATGYHQFGEQSWDIHYQALTAYVEAHGWQGLWRTREFQGLPIQSFIQRQRYLKRQGLLAPSRIEALTALGIHWDRKGEWWVCWIEQLEDYQKQHGHLRLPKTSTFARLQNKVSIFRRRLETDTLPAELKKRLAAINFPLSATEEYWQWAIQSLKNWVAEHGPDAVSREDLPLTLRNFLNRTKKIHQRSGLASHHLDQLRELRVDWAVQPALHSQMIARLTRFARTVGKANVEAMAYQEADLREWLETQLAAASRGELGHTALKDLRNVGIDVGNFPPTDENPRVLDVVDNLSLYA